MKTVKAWKPGWTRMGAGATYQPPTPMEQLVGSKTGKSIGEVVDFAAYYGAAFLAGWGSFMVIEPDCLYPTRRKTAQVGPSIGGGVAAATLWWLFTGNLYGTGTVLAGTAFAYAMCKL